MEAWYGQFSKEVDKVVPFQLERGAMGAFPQACARASVPQARSLSPVACEYSLSLSTMITTKTIGDRDELRWGRTSTNRSLPHVSPCMI